jgi:hypothetical protein
MASGLFQLHCKISQFLGMSGIVTHHVLHQRRQFLHRRMLTSALTAVAATAAIMRMGMLCAVIVQMLVLMGMGMIVGVGVGMFMGMGNTVVGVFVCMGMLMVVGMLTQVIVMQMHNIAPLIFSLL